MEKSNTFFNEDFGIDKEVYENTTLNWVKIFGMLGLFYIFNGFHWAFNFELGVHDSALLTKYNCFLFIINIAVIAGMLIFGAAVNKKKLTHEFYIEKISEERQRQREIQAMEDANKTQETTKKGDQQSHDL